MKKIGLIITTLMATMMFGVMVNAAPAQVTGVKQTNSYETSVNIEWNEVAGDYIYYDVEYSTSSDFATATTARTSSESYYISGLTAGSTYYVRIRAYEYGTTDYSAYSTTLTVVTDPDADYFETTATKATTSSITFTWDAVTGATAYELQYLDGRVFATTTTNSYTFTTNPQEYIYIYPVRKCSTFTAVATGYGSISKYDIVFVPKKMTKPAVEYYFYTSKQVAATWDEYEGASSYQLQYSLYNKKKVIKTITTSIESASLPKVKLNKYYKMRVRAGVEVNGKVVYGKWSDYTYFSQGIKPKVKSMKSNSFTLTWKKVKGAKQYIIYASDKDDPKTYKKVKTTKKTKFTLKKIKKKKINTDNDYYIRIVAVMKNGKKKYYSDALDWRVYKMYKFY